MIYRMVMVKLKDEYVAEREGVARYSEEALAEVPGVQAVQAGVPADDRSARSWDLSLLLRFDDIQAVETYLPHPVHRAYVDEYLAPKMVVLKAWNFKMA